MPDPMIPTVTPPPAAVDAHQIIDSLGQDTDRIGQLIQSQVGAGGQMQAGIMAAAKATQDKNNYEAGVDENRQHILDNVLSEMGIGGDPTKNILAQQAQDFKDNYLNHIKMLGDYQSVVSASPFTDPVGWITGMIKAPAMAAEINTSAAKLTAEKDFMNDSAQMAESAKKSITLANAYDANTEANLQNKVIAAQAMQKAGESALQTNSAVAALTREHQAGTLTQLFAAHEINNEAFNAQLRPLQLASAKLELISKTDAVQTKDEMASIAAAVGTTPQYLERAKQNGRPDIMGIATAMYQRKQLSDSLTQKITAAGQIPDPEVIQNTVDSQMPLVFGNSPLAAVRNIDYLKQTGALQLLPSNFKAQYDALGNLRDQATQLVQSNLAIEQQAALAAGKTGVVNDKNVDSLINTQMMSLLENSKVMGSQTFQGSPFAIGGKQVFDAVSNNGKRDISGSPLLTSLKTLFTDPTTSFNPNVVMSLVQQTVNNGDYDKLPKEQLLNDVQAVMGAYATRRNLVDPSPLFGIGLNNSVPSAVGKTPVGGKMRLEDFNNRAVLANKIMRMAAEKNINDAGNREFGLVFP